MFDLCTLRRRGVHSLGVTMFNPYHPRNLALPAVHYPERERGISPFVIWKARLIHAEYLSSDGQTAYMQRYGVWHEAEYYEDSGSFGSWWKVDRLPDGIVKVESLK